MLRTARHRICCALGLLGWLVMVEPALTVDSYSVIDVATLEQAGGGIVRGVNSLGEVIGTFRSQAGKRGFKLNGREAPGARTGGAPRWLLRRRRKLGECHQRAWRRGGWVQYRDRRSGVSLDARRRL